MDTDTIPVANPMPPGLVDLFIVLGAVVLVALVVFFWVFLFRKDGKRRRKHHHHHHHHRKSYREELQKNASGIKEFIRQRRRRHHHEHRPINPTLAQTGGLPPLRDADQPPPPAPQP